MSNENNNNENNATTLLRGFLKAGMHSELVELLQDTRKYQQLTDRIIKAIGPISAAETNAWVCVLEQISGAFKNKMTGYDPDVVALFHSRYGTVGTVYSGTHDQCMEMMDKILKDREEDA